MTVQAKLALKFLVYCAIVLWGMYFLGAHLTERGPEPMPTHDVDGSYIS
jgi:hypothetical protein